jgi:tripartite-type tricarboxylate transporter receptor subunit TctC
MKSKCILTAAIWLSFLSGSLMAQGYPSQPVRIVVPFAPGGNVDLVAREVGIRIE